MLCEHLIEFEKELQNRNVKETYRGQVWSLNCREWVYYDCYLNMEEIRKRIHFHPCVIDHEHLGTHDGQEAGFICTIHYDAVMGVHKTYSKGKLEIK